MGKDELIERIKDMLKEMEIEALPDPGIIKDPETNEYGGFGELSTSELSIVYGYVSSKYRDHLLMK